MTRIGVPFANVQPAGDIIFDFYRLSSVGGAGLTGARGFVIRAILPPPARLAIGLGFAAPRFFVLRVVLIALGLFALAAPAGGAELIMFERAGCPYCARWNREIAPIYPKTAEGRRAPLRRVDIAQARPGDLSRIGTIVYTPTFVLIDGGREIGRIVGYSGDEMFWSLLAELMAKLDRAKEPRRAALVPEDAFER